MLCLACKASCLINKLACYSSNQPHRSDVLRLTNVENSIRWKIYTICSLLCPRVQYPNYNSRRLSFPDHLQHQVHIAFEVYHEIDKLGSEELGSGELESQELQLWCLLIFSDCASTHVLHRSPFSDILLAKLGAESSA